jgi:ubiquitin C-terminal hydrolase
MVPTCNDASLNPIDRSTYDSLAMQAALVERTGIPPEEIEFTIDQNSGLHASGTVSQKGALSGGHYLAVKVEGTWIVVHDGQDAPFCVDIEAYNFPSEIMPFCQ